MQEDFEGTFPGTWQVHDNSGSTSSEYYWGKRDCRPYAGSYSGWGVGGGTSGSALSCASDYPLNAISWMIFGPFSLSDAMAAELRFMLWLNSENCTTTPGCFYDGILWMASTDGTNFSGWQRQGNTGGWIERVFDLSAVPAGSSTYVDMRGEPNVWIALLFTSDTSVNYAEGSYVDNIILRKCTGATCQASSAAVSGSDGQPLEFPAQMKFIK
jgi:hypothetical protein